MPIQEALTRLATRRGVLSPAPIDEPGTPSDFHTVGGGDEERVPARRERQ